VDPLRSEADAFRVVLIVAAGALTVIGVTLLTSSAVGFVWGLLLAGIGLWRLIKSYRDAPPAGRVAVIVEDVIGEELVAELRETHADADLLLAMVVPPGSSASEREPARERMEISLQRLREAGLWADGRVLEADRGELGGGGPVKGAEARVTVLALRGPGPGTGTNG
jgi:hypothetical protein